MKTKLFISVSVVLLAFVIFLLSLLQIVPLFFSVPLLFGAVFGSVSFMNSRNRFKGFRP
ncbi:MAG: hypothetical protein ACE3JP_08820 [Ectobacillus sp.]